MRRTHHSSVDPTGLSTRAILIACLMVPCALALLPSRCLAQALLQNLKPSPPATVRVPLPDAPAPAPSIQSAVSLSLPLFRDPASAPDTAPAMPAPPAWFSPPPLQSQSPYDPTDPTSDAQQDADKLGSTNVPMDSWVYPALERLAALGLIPSQSIAIRPWTRQECLRQIAEADDMVDLPGASASIETEANRLLADLHRELDNE